MFDIHYKVAEALSRIECSLDLLERTLTIIYVCPKVVLIQRPNCVSDAPELYFLKIQTYSIACLH